MGHSWSSRRRHNRHNHRHHHQIQSLPQPPPPPPVTFPPPPPPPPPPSYAFAANSPYPMLPAPSPPSHHPHHSSAYNYARPMMAQSSYHPSYINHTNAWPGFRPPPPPPPYVDHQSAKKIKNDVNIHKDTIRIEVDEFNPEYHLVSFTFDAMVDGWYCVLSPFFTLAKKGANCTFTPVYPEIHMPVSIPFQKGLRQKFCQSSGTGIDLGFFDINDLSKPLRGEDVFPLVISAESILPSLAKDAQLDESTVTIAPNAQITQAVLEKNDESHFQVKVIKQILWVDAVRYELREIYGISSSNDVTINDNDSGKECVICMTDPKDTAILPCRHMCMCSECAKALRLQSDKCPICRQPIEELIEIKYNHDLGVYQDKKHLYRGRNKKTYRSRCLRNLIAKQRSNSADGLK
ncbi:hypothetical protein HYC85_016240 [Camellia sinensis]|uniref:RING-type E3 ubiquitin transferase n=1 Tax=Camellia sinensis TaxID=4442 RepID=A0A7J7GZ17_CAMSI|nr:hypothetical protein HYC85_016240 [Camellia sinensis]